MKKYMILAMEEQQQTQKQLCLYSLCKKNKARKQPAKHSACSKVPQNGQSFDRRDLKEQI
jgi:hypothetical protein